MPRRKDSQACKHLPTASLLDSRTHLLPPTGHPVVVCLVALGGELIFLHDLQCDQRKRTSRNNESQCPPPSSPKYIKNGRRDPPEY